MSQGSIHGRFQVFHLDHLKYFRAAAALHGLIYVGIARPTISSETKLTSTSHRLLRENNPLTYFERAEMIDRVLFADGFSRNSYRILPFPIDEPAILPDFLPISVPILTTINDSWNIEKINILQSIGYTVEVLWSAEKSVSSTDIRQLIKTGNNTWREMVPPQTALCVEQFKLQRRLQELQISN